MKSRAPLSVVFYLSIEERALFEALHEASTGLSTDHDLASDLIAAGFVEDGGDGRADITSAGMREMLRLREVARSAFEQRRRGAHLARPDCSAVEPVSGRRAGAAKAPTHLGARSGASADRRNVSRAPSTSTPEENP